MAKIYLDPGHGGFDSGGVGYEKRESDYALEIAKKVRSLLEAAHVLVRMSRTEDRVPLDSTGPELTRRTNEANAWGADAYVSIHLNSGGGHGIETWHSISGGRGKLLAQDIQTAVLKACPGYTDRGLKTKQGKNGDYLAVIRQTKMPACLVECGFIDSAEDMERFRADRFAQGIANGILTYLGEMGAIGETDTAEVPLHAAPAPVKSTGSVLVRTAQVWYNARGAGLTVDGIWGPATRKAATASVQRGLNQAYQAGLAVDGVWGPKTAAAVRTLKRGDKNPSVYSLQAALLARGINVGAAGIDGRFGAGTESAVRTYQKSAELVVDGLAGKATFAALCR